MWTYLRKSHCIDSIEARQPYSQMDSLGNCSYPIIEHLLGGNGKSTLNSTIFKLDVDEQALYTTYIYVFEKKLIWPSRDFFCRPKFGVDLGIVYYTCVQPVVAEMSPILQVLALS